MIVRAIVSEWVSLLYSHPHTVNGTKKVRLENETMSSRNNNNFVCGNVFDLPHTILVDPVISLEQKKQESPD